MIGVEPGLMFWGSVLIVVGVLGLYVTFRLMRRSVRKLERLKEDLR